MAANRATVSVSASLLPDSLKAAIGGTTVYDINDNGSANKWFYVRMQTDGTTARDLITEDGVGYFNETITYTDTIGLTVEATDDCVFLVIKNTATTNGSTSSTSNLYVGLSGGDLAVNSGTIVIGPNEVWFARLRGEALSDINAGSSSGDLTYDVYAIAEDGGF